ncbi:cytochrome b [Rhizobium sp. GN54]|uniref:cytochrome b n=1 Tax=Rhizobium sp. GN54 TaxID=2898150 RepID=UPI001E5C9B28|nr:cytochrome b [Rhizobium sp. GN54]MCD2180927.1 cytochrome b [Rhizobium sp. GN54]
MQGRRQAGYATPQGTTQDTPYGPLSICLHWLIAALIFALIGIGFAMRRTEIDPALQFSLYQWHKSLGLTVLALAALREIHWLFARHPQPVADLGPLERQASRTTHVVLALLCLFVPLSGWAVASTSTLAIPTLLFDRVLVPALPLARSAAGEAFWSLVHAGSAYLLLALAALHAAAALHHHFIRRNGVLLRMLGRPAAGNAGRPDGTRGPARRGTRR